MPPRALRFASPQESGRCGRDGLPAKCILCYRCAQCKTRRAPLSTNTCAHGCALLKHACTRKCELIAFGRLYILLWQQSRYKQSWVKPNFLTPIWDFQMPALIVQSAQDLNLTVKYTQRNRIGVLIQTPTGQSVAYASLVFGSPNDYPDIFQVHQEICSRRCPSQ